MATKGRFSCSHYIGHQRSKLLGKMFINLLLICSMIIYIQTNLIEEDPTGLPTTTMIIKNGYDVESYNIQTEDGYILKLHRIPLSRNAEEPTKNYPVVFAHCFLGSSADWIIAGRDRSLPMQLADDGFDVWLVNFRGNTYSRGHESLSDKEYYFWNFSLHELGIYDLPAVIDYVLKKTKKKQLHYIGYSMGTTIFFILASEKPEYQEKIKSNISLGPVANIFNTTSSLKFLSPMSKILNSFVRVVTHGTFLPHSKQFASFLNGVCTPKVIRKHLCMRWFIFLACGYDPYSFDQELLPLILGHYPAGTSSKLIVHFSQFVTTETFGQYDYGHKMNLRYYNSECPPSYNLSSINVPIYIFYGENDLLATPEDVEKLRNKLPNVIDVIKVDNKYFNHLDYIYSKTVSKEVNDPVKKILQETDNENWNAGKVESNFDTLD